MLIRLNADQTERLFILIYWTLGCWLLLCPSVSACPCSAYSACSRAFFLWTCICAPSSIFNLQLPGSRGYSFLHSGFLHTNVLLATFKFGFHFAQYKHVFEVPLSPPPVMYFFPGVLRITCLSVSAKYPCARMAALLCAFFPGPLYVCFDSTYNLVLCRGVFC